MEQSSCQHRRPAGSVGTARTHGRFVRIRTRAVRPRTVFTAAVSRSPSPRPVLPSPQADRDRRRSRDLDRLQRRRASSGSRPASRRRRRSIVCQLRIVIILPEKPLSGRSQQEPCQVAKSADFRAFPARFRRGGTVCPHPDDCCPLADATGTEIVCPFRTVRGRRGAVVREKPFGRCVVIDDDPDILLSARLLLRDLFDDVATFQDRRRRRWRRSKRIRPTSSCSTPISAAARPTPPKASTGSARY